MKEEPTCKERIANELKDRIKEIKRALKSDKKRQEWDDQILAVTKTITYKVELSWGGPADFFIVEVDPEGHHPIISITYHFQDWFDGAFRDLTGEDFELAAQIFDILTEI